MGNNFIFINFASLINTMKINKIIAVLFLLLTIIANGFSQEKVTLSGTITAANSNETVIGANIVIKSIKCLLLYIFNGLSSSY